MTSKGQDLSAWLRRYFELDRLNTNIGRECLAGLTTFVTMAYILIVHPGILGDAGVSREATVAVTAIVAAASSIAMGLYAKRPFALAPYMGENAFVAYTVVLGMGESFEAALGAVLMGGILFALLTLVGLRGWLARAIPPSLRFSFVVGIGLFLTLLGFLRSGIVIKPEAAGSPPLALGELGSGPCALAILGLAIMIVFHALRVRAGILIAVVSVTVLGFVFGLVPNPPSVSIAVPDISPILWSFSLSDAFEPRFIPIVLAIFVLDFVDTIGTLLGVSARANLLDEHGNLADMKRPMLVDSLSTIGAAMLGTTTTGVFIESAAGVEAGGRSGLTAVVTGLCFLPAIFLAEFFSLVPAFAYGPALIFVGLLMFEPIRRIDYDDATEFVPAFLTITLIVFSFNIGQGITAGLIAYPVLKLISGRSREIGAGMWVLAALSASYYVMLVMALS